MHLFMHSLEAANSASVFFPDPLLLAVTMVRRSIGGRSEKLSLNHSLRYDKPPSRNWSALQTGLLSYATLFRSLSVRGPNDKAASTGIRVSALSTAVVHFIPERKHMRSLTNIFVLL